MKQKKKHSKPYARLAWAIECGEERERASEWGKYSIVCVYRVYIDGYGDDRRLLLLLFGCVRLVCVQLPAEWQLFFLRSFGIRSIVSFCLDRNIYKKRKKKTATPTLWFTLLRMDNRTIVHMIWFHILKEREKQTVLRTRKHISLTHLFGLHFLWLANNFCESSVVQCRRSSSGGKLHMYLLIQVIKQANQVTKWIDSDHFGVEDQMKANINTVTQHCVCWMLRETVKFIHILRIQKERDSNSLGLIRTRSGWLLCYWTVDISSIASGRFQSLHRKPLVKGKQIKKTKPSKNQTTPVDH